MARVRVVRIRLGLGFVEPAALHAAAKKYYLLHRTGSTGWLCGPAVEHRSLAGVLSLSCARLVADG